MKARIRNNYQHLSRQNLIEKAYALGASFEMKSYSCSQSVVAAVHEILEMDNAVVKAATSLCGGTANQFLGTCGALAGGVMAIDCFCGRSVEQMSSEERIENNISALFSAFDLPERLANRFWNEYGTIICAQIHRQMFGRIFYLVDEDEMKKFEDMGGHTDPKKCSHVVGSSAKWVMEILFDGGIVEE